MTRPFTFRFVNEIVGSFVLLTLALLVGSVLMAGRMQGWLEEKRGYEILLPADVPTGLRRGSVVQIYGTVVGSVREIQVRDTGAMLAQIQIRGDLIRFVRLDSEAIIRKKFGVAGDAYIDITRGTGDERPAGDQMLAFLDEDVTDRMLTTLRDVSDATKYTLFQVNQLLSEYTRLARALEPPISELGLVLNETRGIAENLHQGKGTAGKLLQDDALYQESTRLLIAVRETMGRVNDVLAETEKTVEDLPGLSHEAAGVLHRSQETLAELEKLLQGLQNHWLVRRYVPGEASPTSEWIVPGALPEAMP